MGLFDDNPEYWKRFSKQQEQEKEPEPEQDEEYVPDHMRYAESLKDKTLADIEKIAGVKYERPGWDYGRMEHGFPAGWIGEEETVPAFVKRIVMEGKKESVLEYMDLVIVELTTQIKENRFSDGTVSPVVFMNDNEEESFWQEGGFASSEDQETRSREQSLEVERLHRAWLVDLKRMLFVEQPTSNCLSDHFYDIERRMIVVRPQVRKEEIRVETNVSRKYAPEESRRLLDFDYTKEKVRAYFLQLADLGFYSEDDVHNFLRANFRAFAAEGIPAKKVKLPKVQDLKQKQLMFFMHQFFSNQPRKKFSKRDACELLFENFQYFENIHRETVYSSMQEAPAKEYPFSSTVLKL